MLRRCASARSSSVNCITVLKPTSAVIRSEEHTSELQSQSNLVCRLLLEKKKNKPYCRTPKEFQPPAIIRLSHSLQINSPTHRSSAAYPPHTVTPLPE